MRRKKRNGKKWYKVLKIFYLLMNSRWLPGLATFYRSGLRAESGIESGLSRDQVKILSNCLNEVTILELMEIFDRTNRTKFRDQVIKPLIDAGWIEMTIPDKPTSSKQKYRITEKGRQLLQNARWEEEEEVSENRKKIESQNEMKCGDDLWIVNDNEFGTISMGKRRSWNQKF